MSIAPIWREQAAYSGAGAADPTRYVQEAQTAPLLVLGNLSDCARGGGSEGERFVTTEDRRDITYGVVNYRHARRRCAHT